MIYNKITKICPKCGSLRIKYGKRKKAYMCYACRQLFETPLKRSLPYRSGKCVHMDPEARLTTCVPQPKIPKSRHNPANEAWRAACSLQSKSKLQTIMIFEKDPDPWRTI